MSRCYASRLTLKVKAEISPAFYKDERRLMECCRYAAATSVVRGIPNSYLIRYIINTYLKRHRLGVD